MAGNNRPIAAQLNNSFFELTETFIYNCISHLAEFRQKGVEDSLVALKQVVASHPEVEFRIIGDGPLRERVEDCVSSNGLEGHVRMLGFMSYGEYLSEMEEADLFLHPSIMAENGDSEGGAPTTILEAQAMGIPVVSTRHADIPNIVDPGESALLVEEGDRDGLAQALEHLLDNQDKWAAMGRAGRRFVEERHDIQKESHLLEEKYRMLIK